MLRVEDVGGGRIVNNNSFSQIATDLRKILYIISLMIVTTFTEKSMVNNVMNVKLVEKWVAILLIC